MNSQTRLKEYQIKKKKFIEDFLNKKKKKQGIRLGKSTSNLFRYRKKNISTINVRDFNRVIKIDKKKLIADVEGMITYENLVKETLKVGLMPMVVPELKTITIGGAVSGVGIESSSFKYGLVHETITEIEVIIGDGSIVVSTPDNKYKDLFYGFPNSYGTLGYILRLKVRLIPVKRYVRLEHIKFSNLNDYFAKLNELCYDEKYDFIDGTIFYENEMYITLGQFADKAPFVSNYKYMNIYYKSFRKKQVDYLTISDYIWRWDTDWFWCSKHFGVQNCFIRLILGKWLLKSRVYWKIKSWNAKYNIFKRKNTESVVQDVEIPIENCQKYIEFFLDEIGIKPVWVCPTKTFDRKAVFSLYEMDSSLLYINFGFWDIVKTKQKDGYYNRKIEKKVKELGGKKSLYSTSYYSEKEFWKLYNKRSYDQLKKKYDPGIAFIDLYNKCVSRK